MLAANVPTLRAPNDSELCALSRLIIRAELQLQAVSSSLELRTTLSGDSLPNIIRKELASMTCTQVPNPHPTPTPTYAKVDALAPPS